MDEVHYSMIALELQLCILAYIGIVRGHMVL